MCFFVPFLEVEMVWCCVNHPGKLHNWKWAVAALNLGLCPEWEILGIDRISLKKIIGFELIILFRKSLN